MSCSSGCLTQDHESYGECLRAKSTHVAYCQSWKGLDYTAQKKSDINLERYRSARKQGIQPNTTRISDVQKAEKWSDRTGQPYGRG